MKMFRETMVELMAGVSIKEMLGGMSEEEIRMMPPFPFPKELFPRDTFPPGLRCNSEGLKGIPPSVSAILKSDNPERLGEMFEAASARDLGEEDEEKEAEQRRRRNKFFGGAAFSAFGGGDMDEFDMEAELLGQLGLDDAMFGSMPPSFNPGRAKGRGGGGTHRRRAKKGGKQRLRTTSAGRSARRMPPGAGKFDLQSLEQASDELLYQILGGQMKDIPSNMASMERLMQSAMGLGSLDQHSDEDEDEIEEDAYTIMELPSNPSTAPQPSRSQSASKSDASGSAPSAPTNVGHKLGKERIAAAKTGDSSALSSLLGKNPDLLNFRGPGVGHTCLHWLCAKNYKGLVVLALNGGAAIDLRNCEGSTPLHAASSNGNLDCVQMLLHYGADPTVKDDYGETPSKVAKDRKHADIHKTLERAAKRKEGGGQPAVAEVGTGAANPSASPGRTEPPSEGCQPQLAAMAAAEDPLPPPQEEEEAAPQAERETPSPPKETTDEISAREESSQTQDQDQAPSSAMGSDPEPKTNELTVSNRIDKVKGRMWMNAAKSGDLGTLKALLGESLHFLRYRGTRTNFSFTGNTAVHWCAAKGHCEALRWLLTEGGDPNAPNNAGSTPVHSAAVNGQFATAEILLFEFSGDAAVADELGDAPRELVVARGEAWAEEMSKFLDLSLHVRRLRAVSKENWSLKSARTALSFAGKDVHYVEKSDLVKAAEDLLSSLPQPRIPARTQDEITSACGPFGAPEAPSRETQQPQSVSEAKGADGTERKGLRDLSAKAKAKGNLAFQSGDYLKATHHYSMAIRLNPGNHVNYSNRSASLASQGKWERALEDGERCIKLAPGWGKGYARKAAALLGMGQAGEALKVYKAGLRAEEGNVACVSGIAEAKEAIRMHQQRYQDMWGDK